MRYEKTKNEMYSNVRKFAEHEYKGYTEEYRQIKQKAFKSIKDFMELEGINFIDAFINIEKGTFGVADKQFNIK